MAAGHGFECFTGPSFADRPPPGEALRAGPRLPFEPAPVYRHAPPLSLPSPRHAPAEPLHPPLGFARSFESVPRSHNALAPRRALDPGDPQPRVEPLPGGLSLDDLREVSRRPLLRFSEVRIRDGLEICIVAPEQSRKRRT
jgi:hypothetical protein